MYKGTSDNSQRRVSRILMKDMPSNAAISKQEELDALRKLVASIEENIVALPKKSEERRALGLKKIEYQTRIKDLKGGIKKIYAVMPDKVINEVAKEILPRWQWEMILKEADRRVTAAMAEKPEGA